jgi:hypothetical protein
MSVHAPKVELHRGVPLLSQEPEFPQRCLVATALVSGNACLRHDQFSADIPHLAYFP